MGDRTSVSIIIGGALPIARLDKLSAAIPAFELTGEWPAAAAND